MNRLAMWILLGATLSPGMSSAQTVVPLQAMEVSLATTEDARQVTYLVIELPTIAVPERMRLEEAYLTFSMDVSSNREEDAPLGKRVTLEVYPYAGTSTKRLDVSSLGTSSMKRTVRVGAERLIRVYVTDFVQRMIRTGASDRRLIVGSVSGDRVAVFDPKALPGTSNTKASLTLHFSPAGDSSASQATTNSQ